MIDYHKELSYFKNTDSTHIQCEIDLVESSKKVVQLVPEAGIAVSHDILFSNYLVPLDLCHGIVNIVDLTIRLPSLQNLAATAKGQISQVFQPKDQKEANTTRTRSAEVTEANDVEAPEDHDAFLSAAVSKARRLRHLRELNAKEKVDALSENSKGASGVVHALNMMKENNKNLAGDQSNNGKITFELATVLAIAKLCARLDSIIREPISTIPIPKGTQIIESNRIDSKSSYWFHLTCHKDEID